MKKSLIIIIFFTSFAYSQNQQTNLNTNQIDSIINKIDFYKLKFEYTNALDCIANLINHYEKTYNIDGLVFCKVKVAEINRYATLFENSAQSLAEAEKIIKKHKSEITDKTLIYFYNRKAALSSEYYQTPDSTLYYSKIALNLSQKNNNLNMQVTSLLEIGHVYEVTNNINNAISYYLQSIDIAKKIKDKALICDAYINLARTYTKNNEFNKALDICDRGLTLLENDNENFQKLLLYDNKTKIYEDLNDKVNAYETLKLRMKYTELFYNKTDRDKLLEINGKYQLIEKNKEIKENKERISREKNKQVLFIIILVLFLLGIISLIYYSRKLKNTGEKLNALYIENDFLLQEANHRINNNLQLIIILISDEIKKINSPESLTVKKILSKVESIATLHRQLYQNKNKSKIDIAVYLNNIKNNFDELFEEKQINVVINSQKQLVGIDHGMYLGLLLTELFINSLKHAFNNQMDKKITVNITFCNNEYFFEYHDNGKESFGENLQPKLIDKLCKQLKVNYITNTNNGFYFAFKKIN